MGGEPGHHAEFWLFRTSRAREAILENTLLKKRPGERIQQQPQPFMVEFSTGSAEEPKLGMVSIVDIADLPAVMLRPNPNQEGASNSFQMNYLHPLVRDSLF
jgi:hypothetical protein